MLLYCCFGVFFSPANRLLEIEVSAVTDRSDLKEGGHAVFSCNAHTQSGEGGPVTVTWKTHPVQSVVDAGRHALELQFANLTAADTGRYVCQARNADGYVEGTVDLNVGMLSAYREILSKVLKFA